MDVLNGTKQHFKNWHVFHIENPQACEGWWRRPPPLAFSRGFYISPGWGGGWIQRVIFILQVTLSLQGNRNSAFGAGGSASAPPWQRPAGLGGAAAGAGRALGAANAVRRAAVLWGRRGRGDLLPSCCLPCVRIDVPQGPRQECSDHKCCKCNAHHG